MKISHSTISNSDVDVIAVNGQTVIEINVRQAPDDKKPIYLNNDIDHSFIRQGSTDAKADKNSLKTLIRLSTGSLDTKVLSNYAIDDLDIGSVNLYQAELAKRESYKAYAELSTEDFLKKSVSYPKTMKLMVDMALLLAGYYFLDKTMLSCTNFLTFNWIFLIKVIWNKIGGLHESLLLKVI